MKRTLFCFALLISFLSISVTAATFSVQNTFDSGAGSLRQAILEANASAGGDIIFSNTTGTIALSSALPEIMANGTITGPGSNLLTISGNNLVRVFTINSGTTSTLSGLTIANGFATNANGAGIFNAGTLRVISCAVLNNQTLAGQGGGIYNSGDLTLIGSILSSNQVIGGTGTNSGTSNAENGGTAQGGGLFNASGTVTITNSAMYGNQALGGTGAWSGEGGAGGLAQGGGIFSDGGVIALDNIIIRGNAATGGRAGMGANDIGGDPDNNGQPGEAGGGAVYAINGTVRIGSSEIDHNQANGGTPAGSRPQEGRMGGFAKAGAIGIEDGILTVVSSTLAANNASGGYGESAFSPGIGGEGIGGAIFGSNSSVTILNSTLSNNHAAGGGGASRGSASRKGGTARGGGIFITSGGVAVINSTLSGNQATGGRAGSAAFSRVPGGDGNGGGIFVETGSLTNSNSTLTENQARGGLGSDLLAPMGSGIGGGIYNAGGIASLHNTILAGNSAPTNAPDAYGTFVSEGHNLIGVTNGATGFVASDYKNLSANLRPLQNNGGPTLTHAPFANNPAINGGSSDGAPAFDQRGVARPQGPAVDIGSFEHPPFAIFIDGPLVTGTVTRTNYSLVELQTFYANSTILFTLDGTEPSIDSTLYSGAFTVSNTVIIRAIGYNDVFSQSVQADPVVLIILPTYSLTVTQSGSGAVLVNPPSGPYVSNTVVTLTATPAAGWLFSHWTGDSQSQSTTINVTMNSNKALVAVFDLIPRRSLAATTGGGGTVSIDPSSNTYPHNTLVTVTATPSAGWTFLHWIGDASGTNPMANVILTRNKCVQALFGTTLGSTVAGNGSVLVQPTNPFHLYGSTVKLTAVPQTGNYFALWGNAASGTNSPLSFVVTNANQSISCLFGSLNAGQFALTIIQDGNGEIDVNPQANRYGNGQNVVLTAIPETNQFFIGWSGDATGTNNPLSVIMNQSRIISAHFTKRPRLNLAECIDGLGDDGYRFTLLGDSGAAYRIDVSVNLAQWTPIAAITNLYGAEQFTDSTATNFPHRFYRAEWLP